jgi:hypothetical protein
MALSKSHPHNFVLNVSAFRINFRTSGTKGLRLFSITQVPIGARDCPSLNAKITQKDREKWRSTERMSGFCLVV